MQSKLVSIQEIHQFHNLALLAKQVVEGFIIGLHKSPFHGFSVEFSEHRLYNPGDPLKNIDWKVYGRSEKLFVKKYEEETNLRCQLVIDVSSSMYFPEEIRDEKGWPVNKLRYSIVATAALIHLLKKQRDAVGISIFSDKVEAHTGTKSTSVHHNLLIATLENALGNYERNKRTATAKCLHEIAENVHKRSLIMIFSDMLENVQESPEIFSALQHLRYNKHEVILFHVTDKRKELDFEFENKPYLFIDMETKEEIKLQSNQVKQLYVERMEEYKKQIALKCAQYRIDFVETDINKDFSQVFLAYLRKREKMG